MKRVLKVLGQLVLTIFWFIYVALMRTPFDALKRRRKKREKEYLDRVVPDDYQFAVTKMADERVNQRFLNDGNDFAKLVAWLMIRHVRPLDEVLIYSKALAPSFYTEIMRASCLLDSKVYFRIVLDDKDGVNVIKTLPPDVQNRIDFRVIDSLRGSHYLVTERAFRYELPEIPNELFVVCNFNEPETAQKLRNNFEKIWANSVSPLAP